MRIFSLSIFYGVAVAVMLFGAFNFVEAFFSKTPVSENSRNLIGYPVVIMFGLLFALSVRAFSKLPLRKNM